MSTQIIEYNQFREKMAEVRETGNFLPNVSTKEGYEKSKRVSLDIGKTITRLETARKSKKATILATGRAIDGEAKIILSDLEAIQSPHKLAYKKLDDAKKEREQDRIDQLTSRIDYMRNLPELMRDSSSEEILMASQSVQSDDCETYYEFTMDALKVRNAAVATLTSMYESALQAEREAAELKELRAKQEAQDLAASAKLAELAKQNQIAMDAAKIQTDKAEGIAAELKEKLDKIDAENAATEARAANRVWKRDINVQAMEALIDGGLSNVDAKLAITLIAKGKINNVRINY